MLSSSLIFSFVAFAAIGIVSTTAIKRERIYPEVIPGPGLPSLASLNLTSADLYTMRLPPRKNLPTSSYIELPSHTL